MEVYFHDWTIYNLLKEHVKWIGLMLERCRQFHLSLNIKKKQSFPRPFGFSQEMLSVNKESRLIFPRSISSLISSRLSTLTRL